MLTQAPFIQARNYTKGARLTVTAVCIHTMEAPDGPKTAENVANWFASQPANGSLVDGIHPFAGTSAHWNVDADSIVQSVREQDFAWHAGPANGCSIGVEHAGYAKQTSDDWSSGYNVALLARSAQLVAEICYRWQIPVRKLSSADLRNGEHRGIFGHVDVTDGLSGGKGHRDPGEAFPWDSYISDVAAKFLDLVTIHR